MLLERIAKYLSCQLMIQIHETEIPEIFVRGDN